MRSLHRLLFVPLISCSLPEPVPPSAEFLVADGNSTYWVRSGPSGISARTSPLVLINAGDRFYELYVAEVTRSYADAIFVREPIYRRDLLSGDSTLVHDDARVREWERVYLARNPNARLLDPEQDGGDEVDLVATAESEILTVVGPYVVYDRRVTVDRGEFHQADSSREAIDVRSGVPVAVAEMARDSALLGSGSVQERGRITWRHRGYDVVARYDSEASETRVILRDAKGHEWPLGSVDSRLPRVFWLDTPDVDAKLRTALTQAFDAARWEIGDTQLVRGRDASPAVPRYASSREAGISAVRSSATSQ